MNEKHLKHESDLDSRLARVETMNTSLSDRFTSFADDVHSSLARLTLTMERLATTVAGMKSPDFKAWAGAIISVLGIVGGLALTSVIAISGVVSHYQQRETDAIVHRVSSLEGSHDESRKETIDLAYRQGRIDETLSTGVANIASLEGRTLTMSKELDDRLQREFSLVASKIEGKGNEVDVRLQGEIISLKSEADKRLEYYRNLIDGLRESTSKTMQELTELRTKMQSAQGLKP